MSKAIAGGWGWVALWAHTDTDMDSPHTERAPPPSPSLRIATQELQRPIGTNEASGHVRPSHAKHTRGTQGKMSGQEVKHNVLCRKHTHTHYIVHVKTLSDRDET